MCEHFIIYYSLRDNSFLFYFGFCVIFDTSNCELDDLAQITFFFFRFVRRERSRNEKKKMRESSATIKHRTKINFALAVDVGSYTIRWTSAPEIEKNQSNENPNSIWSACPACGRKRQTKCHTLWIPTTSFYYAVGNCSNSPHVVVASSFGATICAAMGPLMPHKTVLGVYEGDSLKNWESIWWLVALLIN